jgi:hypothetical protein
MSLVFRILRVVVIALLIAVVGFIAVIGPWPVYRKSGYAQAGYFTQALAAITAHGKGQVAEPAADALKAGWHVVDMTPPVGTPMGGYAARAGEKRSTGVRDPLFVKAIAFSDGKETVVVIGADMLMVPPNIAEAVRAAVTKKTGLPQDSIIFNTTHTHCGPGGLAPGAAMDYSAGPYDPAIPAFISEKMTAAAVGAVESLEPAKLLRGAVQAPEYIFNREFSGTPGRADAVDPELGYCMVQQADGDQAIVVRYSAHPITFTEEMMEFSAEFPGALMRTLEKSRNLTAIYWGGGLGSMGPRAPEAPTPGERVELMGSALAKLVDDALPPADALATAPWVSTADVGVVGIPTGSPELQARVLGTASLRLSPMARHIAYVPMEGWVSAARIGDWFIWGTPYDCSGEMAVRWRNWGKQQALDVWTLSFNGAYLGYLTPDEYYWLEPLGYETGLMSWTGPDASAMMTDYLQHAVGVLSKS